MQSNNHCGECVPCISRRIALEANGLNFNEYQRDIFSETIGNKSETDTGKRNLVELIEFVKHFDSISAQNKNAFIDLFPDLVNEYIDQDLAIQMYARFAKEAFRVFKGYKNLGKILN